MADDLAYLIVDLTRDTLEAAVAGARVVYIVMSFGSSYQSEDEIRVPLASPWWSSARGAVSDPAVLAGVWDHSGFREDMQGRLRRTARFIAVTTFGAPDDARALLARVRTIHDHIEGVLPDGTPYRAGDADLLAWVHVCEVLSFLDGWVRYGEPRMTRGDQDRYVAEMVRIAEPLGVDPIPHTRAEAERIMHDMRGSLVVDHRTRDVAHVLLHQRAPSPAAAPFQAITMQAGVDLLPGWARTMHGLSGPGLGAPLVRAGTFGVASTLRWAFRG